MSSVFYLIFLRWKGIHRKNNHAPFSYNDFQEPKLITTLDLDYIFQM